MLTRQPYPKHRCNVRRTVDLHAAPVGFGDVLDDGQADPQSFALSSAIHPVEAFEHVRLMFRRNPFPCTALSANTGRASLVSSLWCFTYADVSSRLMPLRWYWNPIRGLSNRETRRPNLSVSLLLFPSPPISVNGHMEKGAGVRKLQHTIDKTILL